MVSLIMEIFGNELILKFCFEVKLLLFKPLISKKKMIQKMLKMSQGFPFDQVKGLKLKIQKFLRVDFDHFQRMQLDKF